MSTHASPAPPKPRPRRWALPRPLVVMGVTVALQLAMAVMSVEAISSMRAYVAGESLYSKAQKDAALRLKAYLRDPSEQHYAQFELAMAVPEGDRIAREAMQRRPPDLARAREGFLQGGNDPDDVDGMVRLFLLAQHLPKMTVPIHRWTEGDAAVQEMQQLAAEAREHHRAGTADAATVRVLRDRLLVLNERLSALEVEFSSSLGAAVREMQTVLVALNAVLAALLLLLGTRYVRESQRQQAHKEAQIQAGRQTLRDILDSAGEGICGVGSDGCCTFMNRSGIRLLGARNEADLLGRPVVELLGLTGIPAAARQGQASRLLADGSVRELEWWAHPAQEGEGWVATFIDIGARVAAERALERRALRQQLLAQYGRFALAMPDPTALGEQTLEVVARGLKATACAWFEAQPGGDLRLAASRELEGPDADAMACCARAAVQATARGAPADDESVPAHNAVVRGPEGAHGVITVCTRRAAAFDEGAAEFVQTVALTMATAIERHVDRERLERMAQLDALTGIPNRSLFLDRLGQTLIASVRDDRPVAVLFVDIDRFKQVNDTLGHAVGDALLVAITQRLGACLRPGDTLGRLGGDEFTVALAHLAAPGDAATVAAKIVAEVGRPFLLGPHRAEVSASIGIAVYPDDSRDPETLLQQADLAMYQVKAAGRNGWRFYADSRTEEAVTP